MMDKELTYKISKELIETTDIVSVISSFITIKKQGSNYVAVCPFHNDTKPSLIISPKKKIWKCFVCGIGGTVIKFVQEFKKCSWIEAVKIIGEMTHFDFSKYENLFTHTQFDNKIKYLYDANKEANNFFTAFLKDKKNIGVVQYLEKRGLDKDIINHFKIGYAPSDGNTITNILTNHNNMFGENHDKALIWNEQQLFKASLVNINDSGKVSDFFIDRITFPIENSDGLIVGFSGRTFSNKDPKYLNSKENDIFTKSKILYNFHNIINSNIEKLIIVEGYMDAIAYYRAGFPNVVATMGIALSEEHINLIKSIPTLQTVILSFDNDEAGTNANITNGKKLLEEKIDTYVVGSYDKAIKDVDELLNTKGKEAIGKIIDTRRDYISFLIDQNFSISKPNDEKIHLIKKVLAEMIELDDIMLKTLHLEFLSKYTSISLQDLSAQYDMLLKNKYVSLGYKETINPTPVIKKQTSVVPIATKDSAVVEQYKYKFNVVCNNISSLLQEIIRSCFINYKVITICDEHLYIGALKQTFKIECLILKALFCFNKEDISISEVKQYIFSNYPEERTMLDYFFENLETNSLMPLSKQQALISALSIINNINDKKYEFENLQLSILLSKEEEKGADKDENLIIELSNKIRTNNVAKKNKH